MRYTLAIVILLLGFAVGCSHQAGSPPVNPPVKNNEGGTSDYFFTPTASSGMAFDPRRPEPPVQGEYVWFPSITEPYDCIVEELYIPSLNGKKLHAKLFRPDWASGEKPCHGLVLVPGGIQVGDVWHVPWRRSGSKHWAKSGFVVIEFDFQGRGLSEGTEDRGGPQGREDLKAIIEYMIGRPDVLKSGVGLVSSSMGVVPCAGALATWTDLPVRFWIDLEGAHDRYSATQWDDPFWVGLNGGHLTSDDEYWSEREAIKFQPFITTPYIRIQSDLDHSFDYYYVDHAFEMVNAAVNGASPYARMNHNKPNQILDLAESTSYEYENIYDMEPELYSYVIQASIDDFE